MKPHSTEIDGKLIQIAPPDCRPPGKIADQETDATGVWVRLGPDGEWKKSHLTRHRAGSIVFQADSAEEAMKALLVEPDAPVQAGAVRSTPETEVKVEAARPTAGPKK